MQLMIGAGWSVRGVAKYMGLKEVQVRRALEEGHIPDKHDGRRTPLWKSKSEAAEPPYRPEPRPVWESRAAEHLGDPPIGRSALDRRNENG